MQRTIEDDKNKDIENEDGIKKREGNVYGTGISRERKIPVVFATGKTNFSLVC